jgi:hypothetical protein
MATEEIRVGIIGASMSNGWGRDAHLPALSALPEFEITAVSTSRQETADETARHFGIPLAFADPYKMVQHPDVDLVSICVRVPFHHQLGMAALNAGKHLYCEWPLAATTEQAQQMHDLAVRNGVHHMVGLQARGSREFNRVRDLVAEGYVGKVLSCTMIITTPTWGTEFTRDWAYMADRSNGNTLMTSSGGHSIDALCFCLGEFKPAGEDRRDGRDDPDDRARPSAYKRHPAKRRGRIGPPQRRLRQRDGVPVRDPRHRGRPGHRAGTPSPGDLHTGLRIHCARRAGGRTAGGSLDTGELSLGSTRGPGRASFQRCAAVQADG